MARWTFLTPGGQPGHTDPAAGGLLSALATHVPDVPPVPPPRPNRVQSIPGMNQQERMLPALGQRQQPSPTHGDSEAAVGWGASMPQAPPHAQPLLMLSQEQHGGLHLLPIAHPGLTAQN